MSMYLGDYNEDDTLHFTWDTSAIAGGSITRSTDGTISVYKDNGVTQSVAGVTDTEDFDALTGVHACTIVLTDGFYVTGADYSVVLSASTIDGKTVNATLAGFSIENRFMRGTDSAALASALTTAQADLDIITGATGVNLLTATQTSIDAIEVDTNLLNDTKIPDTLSLSAINAEVDSTLTDYDAPTNTELNTAIATLATPDQVLTQAGLALTDIHLDHLLAANYDPAAKPGVSTALLNEIIENDSGISRLTANALENGPTGSGANSILIISIVLDAVVDASNVSIDESIASPDANAYKDLVAVIVDQATGTQKSWVGISSYSETTGNIVFYEASVFLPVAGDTLNILAIPYTTLTQINAQVDTAFSDYDGPTKTEMDTKVDSGFAALNDLTAAQVNAEVDTALTDYDPPTKTEMDNKIDALSVPTVGQIADAVLDEALAGHVAAGSLGKAVADVETDTAGIATVDTVVDAIKAVTDLLPNSGALSDLATILADTGELQVDDVPGLIAALNNPTAAAIADAVLDEALSGHVVAGSLGKAVADVETDTAGITTVDTVVDAIKAVTDLLPNSGALSDLATILADTNELQTDDIPGVIAALSDTTASVIADAVLDEALSGHVIAGTLGKAIADIETDATAILADTAELQGDWVDGGRLDLIVDLVATQASVDVVDGVVDSILVDTGTTVPAQITALNNISTAEVNTQVDTALTDYDGPTRTEATADKDSVEATIAALNDVSTLEVNAQVDIALGDYDAPKKDEMDSGFAALSTPPTSAAIADAVLDELLSGHAISGSAGEALTNLGTGDGDATAASQTTILANIAALNDLSTAQVNTEVDTALTDYDAPTRTEATADKDSIEAVIAALTDISAVAVNAEVANALATYDPPTRTEATADKAELVADIAAISIPSAATISTTVWGETTRALTDKLGYTITSADHTLIGTAVQGALNDLSTADVNAQCDLALSDYDGPTRLEATADKDSVEAVIATLNDISAADVNTQCDVALTDYDAPTRAELTTDIGTVTAAITALNDPTVTEIRTELAAELAFLDVAVSSRLAAASYTDVSANVTSILSNSAAILVDTDELQILVDELVEGSTPNREFTTAALANSTTSGGDATLANQTTIIAALSSGPATIISILDGGTITTKIGDSHTGSSKISLTVTDVGATLHASMTAAGVVEVKMGVSDGSTQLFVGTIVKTEITEAADITTIPITLTTAATATISPSNDYKYDIQYEDGDGDHTPIEGAYNLRSNFAT